MKIRRNIACTNEIRTVKQIKLIHHENGHTFFIHKNTDNKKLKTISHFESGMRICDGATKTLCISCFKSLVDNSDFEVVLKSGLKKLKKLGYKYPINKIEL